jgi:hypothetical protein
MLKLARAATGFLLASNVIFAGNLIELVISLIFRFPVISVFPSAPTSPIDVITNSEVGYFATSKNSSLFK